MNQFTFFAAVRIALMALCLVRSAEPAAAQSALETIAAEKTRREDPALSSGDRLASIERTLTVRRALIQSRPNDSERALWLADQAHDIFFDLLAQEGSGLAALFGAPPPPQRMLVNNAAREMFESASQAELAIGQAIMVVESSPGFPNDSTLQQKRRDLAEVQRGRRIPFLRGIGAALHAEFNVNDAAERGRLFRLAVQLLSPLIATFEGIAPPLATEARIHAGLAKARLGEFDAAEEHFAAVARDSNSTPAQIFAARMGGALNRAQRGGPQAGLEALASIEPHYSLGESSSAHLFYRVLIADQKHLLLMQLAGLATEELRPAAVAQAFSPYSNLWHSASAGAPSSEQRETLRSIVFSRLGAAAAKATSESAVPINDLPALAAVAYAERLSSDAATRARAISILEGVLSGDALNDQIRAEALFALARAMYEHGQPFFAAQRFRELAARFPTFAKAQQSVEAAAALAANLHDQSPADHEAQTLLREALELLLDRYPNLPTIDRWRFAAARLALEQERFDEASALLDQITPDAAEWPDAHFMQVAVERARAARTADAAAQKRVYESIPAVIDRHRPAIEAAARASKDQNRLQALNTYLGLLRVYRAEALLQAHQPQAALDALANIEDEPAFGSPVRAQTLKVRITAHQSLKQPEQAIGEMRRLMQAAPEHAGEVLAPMLASMQNDVEALIEIGRDEPAADLAQSALLPAAELYEQWLKSESQSRTAGPDDFRSTLRIADAYRLTGRFADALPRYERILKGRPDSADALVGKAECLYGLGSEPQLAGAMEIYKRLAAAGPDAAPKHYWLSQLRMLQILDRVNRNTGQIRPRIEQLRQQDRDFGGERFRRGFEALRQKYVGKPKDQ